MRILGVDPGMARTGFGVIECQNNDIKVLTYGCITTPSQQPFAVRLKKIFDRLYDIIESEDPSALAMEDVFFSKNAKLALTIGQARGVILLLAVEQGIPTFEYTVREVKQAVTGNGSASKEQVQRMVTKLLSLPEPQKCHSIQ